MTLPEEIRRSLAAGDFARAGSRFEEHARNLAAGWRQGACVPQALEEAHDLLYLALAAREHLKQRLLALRSRCYVAGAYTGSGPRL